jgi:hypothetical protein
MLPRLLPVERPQELAGLQVPEQQAVVVVAADAEVTVG